MRGCVGAWEGRGGVCVCVFVEGEGVCVCVCLWREGEGVCVCLC